MFATLTDKMRRPMKISVCKAAASAAEQAPAKLGRSLPALGEAELHVLLLWCFSEMY